MFVSAALLFLVEPMLAKMMLPMLGGTPAVWNTCLMFFQAALLAGYLYAHGSLRWLGRRTQIVVHLALIALPLLPIGLLPLHLPAGWNPPVEANPAPWVMGMLLVAVGLPFSVLSANTPILQRWFARTGHVYAHDPYFLYAASNAGSLIGLLSYPLVLEPLLRLREQSSFWTGGYVVFAVLALLCAVTAWRGSHAAEPVDVRQVQASEARIAWRRRLRWIALAFVPSSLMLGVTTAMTTDVPALPLFWVLPLTVYLLSFVIVFARRPVIHHEHIVSALPAFLLAGLLPFVIHLKLPLIAMIVVYLSALGCVALFCHGELAADRPSVEHLTEFYLLMSLGGVLGGIFNSLVAPVVFHSAVEFPLVLVMAALLRRPTDTSSTARARMYDFLLPATLAAIMAIVLLGAARLHYKAPSLLIFLFFAYCALICFSFHRRRIRYTAGVAAFAVAGSLYTGPWGHVLQTDRNFFGVVRVANDDTGGFRTLIHAGTNHGMQSLDPKRSREPLSYYTSNGPAGQVFQALRAHLKYADVAVVGLGAGSMACLTTPDEKLTYYEIDPLVVRFARDTRYFTFLAQCAPHAPIVLGDARLELHDAPDGGYKLIALDAFSGDSIPVHLLTREALALYLRKLTPDGVLLFHISSRYLNLEPTLGNLARGAHLVSYIDRDTVLTPEQEKDGMTGSVWLVMAHRHADVAAFVDVPHSGWKTTEGDPHARIWTDDYSNLLSVVHW